MVYKMISCKSIIAKIIADLGLDENKIKISDWVEWIGEAVSKIGSISQKKHKVKVIPIKGYQCKLPCDLEQLDMVAYSDNGQIWQLTKKTTNGFGLSKKEQEYLSIYGQSLIIKEDLGKCENINNSDVPALFTQKVSSLQNNNNVEYDTKPGYLLFNTENGFAKISYYAEYTDDEGMPLIPDLASYSEAIYWYVVMKLLYIEYFTGRKPQHLYYDAKRSWNFYRQQAYAESLMPNTNEIENIKNTWHTLVPEFDESATFFNNLGNEQIIYNHN